VKSELISFIEQWYGITFALLGTFLLSLGTILVRRGLVESDFLSATVITNLIGAVVFCILSLLTVSFKSANPVGIVLFALAGLFSPAFTRLTLFKGMEKLGASINASIFAVYPLFSSLLAVLLLGERPSFGVWVGIICIICGIIVIERNIRGTSIKSASPRRMWLAFPLVSALLLGFANVLRKMGLNVYNEPIVGSAIAYLSAICLYVLLSTNMKKSKSVNRKSLRLFWKAGLMICAGYFCTYYALGYGEVSTLAPLMSIEPFFVFILVYIFLRDLEKITFKLVIGTLIVVTGVLLTTMF
jgi:drug/metabolite transporter (DMT)-like permease